MAIDAAEQIEKFQEFVEQSYQSQLHDNMGRGLDFVVFDFFELTKYDPKLADQLLEEPEETLKAAEVALEQFDVKSRFRVRFKNLPKSQEIFIRNLRSKHLAKFIAMEGIVRQSSEVRPQAVSAKFECPSCGNTITMPQVDQSFREPSRCTCGRKGKFRLLSKDLVDVQRLVIEESPENLEGGAQPKRMQVFLREDLVEPRMEKRTVPGTRVIVNGSLYEVPIPTRTGGTSTRFDLALQSNFIDAVEEDYSEVKVRPEDEKKIKKLARDKKIYERLVASVSPSIYGHDKIKEAIMLQMFGGIRKTKKDGTVVRGDLHVLLVGDPGCGKSQMLTFVDKVSPKSRYVAGRSASGAGLTCSVVKDEFLRGWALEAGAMVLADKGILVLDEMDKISREDTSALHEAMEQQSYHPNFKIMFADGSHRKIGAFVDELIEQNKSKVILGKDCEILSVDGYDVFTTDFSKLYPTKVDRVSRHKAPSEFIEVSFSNGRKVMVTPEHPFFVFQSGKYKEILARDLKFGEFVPAPRRLPFGSDNILVRELNSDLGLVVVKSVRRVKNEGVKWVYDVTVEPNQSFVSEGLVLHNSISVAKANIQATLRTQTSVLAAANPKLGRFDPFTPLPNQIDMPPALINRFDLIFVMRDMPNKELDSNIASRVLASHSYEDPVPEIEGELLRKYLAYVKQKIFPKLTKEAVEEIKQFYVALRATGSEGDGAIKPIPISARQLEAVVRLSEAAARIKLKDKVEVEDARRAIGLLKYCMNEIGVDPETGRVDLDRMTTGISASTRGVILEVRNIIFALCEEKEGAISIDEDLKPKVFDKGVTEQKLEEAIDKLKRGGDIFEPKKGWLQKI